jgi:hypothetical protein
VTSPDYITPEESRSGHASTTYSWRHQLRKARKGNRLSRQECARLWQRMRDHYCQRDLTFAKDKLVAISGIAAQLHANMVIPHRYLAGLWKHDFVQGMCWYRINEAGYPAATRLPGPTWSWASINAKVQWAPHAKHWEHLGHSSDVCTSVISVSVLPSSEGQGSPFGQIASSEAVLEGPVLDLAPTADGFDIVLPSDLSNNEFPFETTLHNDSKDFILDVELALHESWQGRFRLLLPVLSRSLVGLEGGDALEATFMVIREVELEDLRHTRVGLWDTRLYGWVYPPGVGTDIEQARQRRSTVAKRRICVIWMHTLCLRGLLHGIADMDVMSLHCKIL